MHSFLLHIISVNQYARIAKQLVQHRAQFFALEIHTQPMIGTEDMSASAGMDISESFRAEDLSKTDFFDFVTAPDMGIGIGVGVGVGVDVGVGVGVSLQQQQQQQQHHQHQHTQHTHTHTHTQHTHSHNHQSTTTSQTPQQAVCGAGARSSSNSASMTHGAGGGTVDSATVTSGGIVPVSNRNDTSNSNGDPTLQGYEVSFTIENRNYVYISGKRRLYRPQR